MVNGRAPRTRGRTWAQRAVIVVGSVIVLVCSAGVVTAGYIGVRLAQIDRVDGIETLAAARGEPANYLIVGTDSREGIDADDPDSGGLIGDGELGCDCTDTIMVMRVDPKETTAQVLSFPRDLWLRIADGTTGRINGAHAKGEQVLIDTIEENFGIPIHHYIEVDFVGFARMVDAAGGIPMWFDAPVRDREIGLSIPEPQCQVLDGEAARKFVRSRHMEFQDEDGDWRTDQSGDLGRITRQQIFIRRAVTKAVSRGLSNINTLNELVSAGVANVRLDHGLDASDLVALGRQFADFDAEELQGYSIPSERTFTSGGADVQVPLMREAELILNIFRGLPPGAVTPAAVDVTVLNGTDIPGQAADAAGALQAIGFNVVDVDDHDEPLARTTVFFGDGGEDAARRVARHLTGGADLVHDGAVDNGAVVLVTGSELTTIHDQPAPEGSPDDLRSTTSTTAPPPSEGGETPPTTEPETTTTTPVGYATGEPPAGVDCG